MKKGRKAFGDSKQFDPEATWRANEQIALSGSLPIEHQLVQEARLYSIRQIIGRYKCNPDFILDRRGKQAQLRLFQILMEAILKSDAEPIRRLIDAVETPPYVHPLEANILDHLKNDIKNRNWRKPGITVEQLAEGLRKPNTAIARWWALVAPKMPDRARQHVEELLPYLASNIPLLKSSYYRQIRRACQKLGVTLLDSRKVV